MITMSAIIFSSATALVIFFYVALILGAPWGAAAMGGKFPGKFPVKMRVVSFVNIGLLMFLNIIVLSKAKLLFIGFYDFSKTAIWGVVVFFLIGTVLNAITPSKIERIWAPVALASLIASTLIALN